MKCPTCKAECGFPDFETRYHTVWANQFGCKIRVFCKRCNEVNDVTELVGKPIKIQRKEMSWDGKHWRHAELGPRGITSPNTGPVGVQCFTTLC